MATIHDMQTSLEDARFFFHKMEPVIRGPEQQQDLELIRRYFRAYLHCWKCVVDFVRDAIQLSGTKNRQAWIAWCKKWAQKYLQDFEIEIFHDLRTTRDRDTHEGMIELQGQLAMGLHPLVMFKPGKVPGPERELVSCCEYGLAVVEKLMLNYQNV